MPLSRPDVAGSLLAAVAVAGTAWAYRRLRREVVTGQRRIMRAIGQLENQLLDAVADVSTAAHSIGVASVCRSGPDAVESQDAGETAAPRG